MVKEEVIQFNYQGDPSQPPPKAPRIINGCDFDGTLGRGGPCSWGFHDFGDKKVYYFANVGDRTVIESIERTE